MTVPNLILFHNKRGVGTISLAFIWLGCCRNLVYTVLVCDLDSQADMTVAKLGEAMLEVNLE